MDTREMRNLEKKTRAIVATLSELEGETKRQKEMGDKLELSRVAIMRLANELQAVAEQLAGVISMLNQSTLAEDVAQLGKIEGSCSEIAKGVDGLREAADRREAELAGRLDALEAVIGRIDRNTQKGIGKERG